VIRIPAFGTVALAALLVGCAREERAPRDAPPAAGQPAETSAPASADVVAAQPPYYTLANCPVCAADVAAAGGAQDVVHDGKLIRVCSDDCRARLAANPAPFIAARDSALIAVQLASYPTDSCVVMSEPLDVLGSPRSFVWGARLVRVCCDVCEEQFREDPSRFLAILDAKSKSPGASLPKQASPN
jgi:hypothetical protein